MGSIFDLFKKPLIVKSNVFGDLKYNPNLHGFTAVKADVSVRISNLDELILRQNMDRLENLYSSLIVRAEDYTRELIVKLQENEKIKVSKLQLIAVSFIYSETNISTELIFKETESSELAGHWVIVAVDKDLNLEGGYGLEG